MDCSLPGFSVHGISQARILAATAAAKSLQSCPTLCDPRDGSPPGSPVPGILQARTLEWVAISFSNAWEWKVKVKSLSRVRLLATSWTAAPRLLHPWIFQARVLEWGAIAFSHKLVLELPKYKYLWCGEAIQNLYFRVYLCMYVCLFLFIHTYILFAIFLLKVQRKFYGPGL